MNYGSHPISTYPINYAVQTSSPLAVKTEEAVGTPPPPSGGEYLESGHTQLSSVSSPPIGLRDPAPPISTLATTQNPQTATMLATTATDTSTTPSASHMPSYGTGLTSPSAAAYGASSLSAYGSTYPYGTLGASAGTADVWGASAATAGYGTAGAYSSYPTDYAGSAAAFGTQYPSYYNDMSDGVRRKNATRESTNTLKAWLNEHKKNPYPTKGEKIMLAIITKMTLTQVSTWFANARRRLKKENKMTWVPKNRATDGEDDDSKNGEDDKDDKDDVGVSFDHDKDDKRSEHHPAGYSPSNSANPITSYSSPVASLQTWVNGFNPPQGGLPGGSHVKTESPPGALGSSPGASLGGVGGESSGATSSEVSPLSATSSSPYTTAVSASHLSLHPSYAAGGGAGGASGYDPGLASYYPGYYHPSASALTTMDPSSYYSSQTTGTSHISPKY